MSTAKQEEEWCREAYVVDVVCGLCVAFAAAAAASAASSASGISSSIHTSSVTAPREEALSMACLLSEYGMHLERDQQ
jgi:hypothetical protein